MLKDEIEENMNSKKKKKLELTMLTRHIRDAGYKTELTTYKAYHNKL
jgi:hypothetical protein